MRSPMSIQEGPKAPYGCGLQRQPSRKGFCGYLKWGTVFFGPAFSLPAATEPAPVLGDANFSIWLGVALGSLCTCIAMAYLFWRSRQRAFGLTVWGRSQSQPLIRSILARANILLWSATIKRVGEEYVWTTEVMPQSLSSPLMRLVRDYGRGGFWRRSDLPEDAIMHERMRRALQSEAPGYQQEFPVRDGDSLVWLSEEVGIQRTGPDTWFFFGVLSDVTQRHQVEEARRVSANQVRTILERTDCLLWQCEVTDLGEGRLDWLFDVPDSSLQRRVFGRRGGFRTRALYKGFQVDQLPEMNETGAAAIFGGRTGYEQEFRITRLGDHQSFWLHERVGIESAGPGRWTLFGATFDVTAKRNAEEAHKRTEELLREIVQRVDCILWHAEIEFRGGDDYIWQVTAVPSALYTRIFGADPEQGNAMLWTKDIVPTLPELHRRSSQAFRDGVPGYEQEFEVVGKGRPLWVHERVTIRRRGDQSFEATGVLMDITARKTAEIALGAEKERLAVTLHAMEEGVVTLNAEGVILYENKAAESMSRVRGYGVGLRLAEAFSLVHAERGDALPWPFEKAFSEGLAEDLPTNAALRDADGRRVAVEGCCVPLRDALGGLQGAVLVLRDVTERQRLELELQRASKLESVGLLAGGIAHDFNNIMTAVMGNLDLALYEGRRQHPLEDYLKEAAVAARRAKNLTQQLLTFSKGGDPVRSSVSLPELIDEVARFTLRGSRVRSEIRMPADLWPADADKGQLSQIVQNLVLNAAQAMPEGGHIKISASNEKVDPAEETPEVQRRVRLVFEDDGPGIQAEHLPKIFDPYFTTKSGGNGLGLATVYSIVRKHRGSIEVSSELGKGTRFILKLPASDAAQPPHDKTLSSRREAIIEKKIRILVMDDEAPIRRLIQRLLERSGYEVDAVDEGSLAVDRYRAAWDARDPYALVVVDLTVPGGLGGREAFARIRLINPEAKGIVASGYSSDPVMSNHRAHGFSGVAVKPFEAAVFVQLVGEAIAAESVH